MDDPNVPDKSTPVERPVTIHYPPEFPVPMSLEKQRAWLMELVALNERQKEQWSRSSRHGSSSTGGDDDRRQADRP